MLIIFDNSVFTSAIYSINLKKHKRRWGTRNLKQKYIY